MLDVDPLSRSIATGRAAPQRPKASRYGRNLLRSHHEKVRSCKLAAAGKMNKQVAGNLGLSEVTVKIHRGAAMRKMGARTLADLVRMAEALKLPR